MSKKNIEKHYSLKAAVAFVAVALLSLGVIFVLRALLINSPIKLSSDNSDLNEKKYQSYTLLDELVIKPIAEVNQNFGMNLTNSFSPKIESKVYLAVSIPDGKYLGYLDFQNKFTTLYKLTGDVRLIKLFQDESIAYVVKDREFGKDSLIVAQQNTNSIYYQFPAGTSIKSIFFQTTEKVFYISLINDEGLNTITYLKADGTLFNLIEKPSTIADQILNVTLSGIYLKNENKCTFLQFDNKSLNNADCQSIQKNELNIDFVQTDKELQTYKNQTGTIKTLSLEGRNLANAFADDDAVYFIDSIKATASLVRMGLNTDVNILETITDSIPFGNKISFIFYFGGHYYAVVEDTIPVLLEYNPNVKNTSTYKDWDKVDIKFSEGIVSYQLLNSNPVIP